MNVLSRVGNFTAPPATPITAGGNTGNVTVALEDAGGNTATSSAPVMLAITGPNGFNQSSMATTSGGTVTFPGFQVTAAGTYSYTASSTGLTSAMATQVVNAGPAAASASPVWVRLRRRRCREARWFRRSMRTAMWPPASRVR